MRLPVICLALVSAMLCLPSRAQVPVMTQGSAVQPGYDGSMYFPGATGTLVRLTPAPVDGGPQP